MRRELVSKIKKKHAKTLQKALMEVLDKECVPRVKEIILEDYDFELNDVANPRSKLAPERFMDEFGNRLNDFSYLEKTTRGVKVITPETDTFDFSDDLDVIENILEGIIGKYVEVDRRDYQEVTNQSTYRGQHKAVYLIRYTDQVKDWEARLDKKFEEYAFSNTPPIDIFGRADQFVKDNIDAWISKAIEKSSKEIDL